MTLSMAEKQILYTFGCPDWHNTVKRLQTVKELTTDPSTREQIGQLYSKLTEPNAQEGYQMFLPASSGVGGIYDPAGAE